MADHFLNKNQLPVLFFFLFFENPVAWNKSQGKCKIMFLNH